jgi:hypothetical protein
VSCCPAPPQACSNGRSSPSPQGGRAPPTPAPHPRREAATLCPPRSSRRAHTLCRTLSPTPTTPPWLAGPGSVEGTPYLYNHLRFVVKFHKEDSFVGARVVGFEVPPPGDRPHLPPPPTPRPTPRPTPHTHHPTSPHPTPSPPLSPHAHPTLAPLHSHPHPHLTRPRRVQVEPLSVKHQYKGKFTTDMSNLNLLTVPVGPDLPPQPVAVKKEAANVPEVVYTYDVKWEYSEIKRAPMSGGGQRPVASGLSPAACRQRPVASGQRPADSSLRLAGGREYPARSASLGRPR